MIERAVIQTRFEVMQEQKTAMGNSSHVETGWNGPYNIFYFKCISPAHNQDKIDKFRL